MIAEGPGDNPRKNEHGQTDGDDPARTVAICEAAGDGCDRGADGAKDSEAAGDTRAQAVVRRAEQEDECRPEGAEGSEDQSAHSRRFDQKRLGAEDGPQRAERVNVLHGGARRHERHGAAQQQGQRDQEDSCDEKDGAPVEPFRDPSGEGAAEQDAQQQAGHDRADGAPGIGGCGDLRSNG